jgi:hypothetical protein
MVVVPIASARIPYDPLRDFDAIYRLATIANAFVVHPSIPVSSLKDQEENSCGSGLASLPRAAGYPLACDRIRCIIRTDGFKALLLSVYVHVAVVFELSIGGLRYCASSQGGD